MRRHVRERANEYYRECGVLRIRNVWKPLDAKLNESVMGRFDAKIPTNRKSKSIGRLDAKVVDDASGALLVALSLGTEESYNDDRIAFVGAK